MKPPRPTSKVLAIIAITSAEPTFAETLDSKGAMRGDSWNELLDQAIDHWSMENGVVVTQRAREKLARQVRLGHGDRACGGCRGCAGPGLDTIEATLSILSKLPTIHLIVQPGPPGDYSVTINGHPYPSTEKGIYCIAPGSVTVKVERTGKSPCDWSGTLSNGQAQTVACTF